MVPKLLVGVASKWVSDMCQPSLSYSNFKFKWRFQGVKYKDISVWHFHLSVKELAGEIN